MYKKQKAKISCSLDIYIDQAIQKMRIPLMDLSVYIILKGHGSQFPSAVGHNSLTPDSVETLGVHVSRTANLWSHQEIPLITCAHTNFLT